MFPSQSTASQLLGFVCALISILSCSPHTQSSISFQSKIGFNYVELPPDSLCYLWKPRFRKPTVLTNLQKLYKIEKFQTAFAFLKLFIQIMYSICKLLPFFQNVLTLPTLQLLHIIGRSKLFFVSYKFHSWPTNSYTLLYFTKAHDSCYNSLIGNYWRTWNAPHTLPLKFSKTSFV